MSILINRRKFLLGASALLAAPAILHFKPASANFLIRYVQNQYYWIPRIHGQNQETGIYAQYPAGAWQWISDVDPNNPPYDPCNGCGLQQRAIYLPLAFPRQAYFTGTEIALSHGDSPAGMNEFGGWIDPKGHFYNSANGAEAGANFIDSISLFHVIMEGRQRERWHREYDVPILCDRDQGDKIGFKAGFNSQNVFVFVGMKYLVRL